MARLQFRGGKCDFNCVEKNEPLGEDSTLESLLWTCICTRNIIIIIIIYTDSALER